MKDYLRQLNQNEVRAVIAHELGHIKHKDYLVMTVLSFSSNRLLDCASDAVCGRF